MIQQLNRYGPLLQPEELKHIQVNGSPIDIVKATYQMWLPIVQRSGFRTYTDLVYKNPNLINDLYEEAANLLTPFAKVFGNILPKELESILADVKQEDTDASGLYLSALLNTTDLQELDGNFNYSCLGFRLAPGKKLVVREESEIPWLGDYAEGELLNWGKSFSLAREASNGLQINFGKPKIISSMASGGIQINYAETLGSDPMLDMAERTLGGIQLNFGSLFEIGHDPHGGIQINMGVTVHEGGVDYLSLQLQRYALHTHLQERFDDIIYHLEKYLRSEFNIPNENIISKGPALEKMYLKLMEIERIKDLKNKPDEAIAAIRSYDWNSFEQEIIKLRKEIMDT